MKKTTQGTLIAMAAAAAFTVLPSIAIADTNSTGMSSTEMPSGAGAHNSCKGKKASGTKAHNSCKGKKASGM